MPKEIEIKFRIDDLTALTRALKRAGFKQITRSTHEMNSLYDLAGPTAAQAGRTSAAAEVWRDWVLTHKSKGKAVAIRCASNWKRE